MLYRVIIGNYKSFADQSQFDMFPNLKRENFINHVYTDDAVPVLKECAIYGANGSGKSNFIQALRFVKGFATSFDLNADKSAAISFYNKYRFRLPVFHDNRPMSFLVEFSTNLKSYIYIVELDNKGISEESLYISGLGKEENKKLFTRRYGEVRFGDGIATREIMDVFSRQIEANPSLSVLGIIGKLHLVDNKHIKAAYKWLDDNLDVIEVDSQIPWLIQQFGRQPDMMKFVRKVFKEIGLGLSDLSIRTESFDQWLQHAEAEDKSLISKFMESGSKDTGNLAIAKMDRQFPHLTITDADGEKQVQELIFTQLGRNGYKGEMECATQSVGTLRLLTLVPAIYFAMNEGKTVMIDEINNSIHPMLIKQLIRFFCTSKTDGQLIFTTHETALLNQQELLRPDEVWLMEKIDGATKMYSLNDFKIHKTVSLENGYLDGRYRAIPFIGNLDLLDDGLE